MRQSIAVSTLFAFLLLVGPSAFAQEQTDREKLKQKAQEQNVDKDKLKGKAQAQGDDAKDLQDRTKAKRGEDAQAEDGGGHAGAIAGGIAAVAGTVVAKSKGGNDKKETETTLSFGTMDANKDGKLSQDEFLQTMSRGFDASDKNRDGKVTRDEAVAAYGERGGSYFDALDDEKSGAVSMEALELTSPLVAAP